MQNPAVILRISQGRLAGATFVFDKPSICVLGRGDSCFPRLPNDEHFKDVSRYHCMLVITPPQVFIQDLGSCNGTFVNGERLRTDFFLDSAIASLQRIPSARFPLEAGDQFALGQNAIFQVGVVDGKLFLGSADDSTTFIKGSEEAVEDPLCSYSVAKSANAS